MKHLLYRFMRNEEGATAIEYGLIAALLGIGIIAAAKGLGSQINTSFNSISTQMKNA